MFVAAGLTVTAFQMLEITALAAVQWAPRVQIALMGLAKCDIPSTKSPVKFAHIELGILTTVDIDEAQLSPNFLITYAPFHFMATVRISVGVRFSMDIWFVTVNIAVEVAAQLALMGPPLRGIVHVDFWVFGFDIAFGDSRGAVGLGALALSAFWNLVTQAESKSADETGPKAAWEQTPTPQEVVDMWQGVFGWTSGCLSGNKPQNLISHVDTHFLSAPLPGMEYVGR